VRAIADQSADVPLESVLDVALACLRAEHAATSPEG
jgi:hypothetical protein